LKDRRKGKNDRVPFVVTFHPALPNLPGILRNLQPVLESSSRCRGAIGRVPMVAYRKPRSLKDMLVHSSLKEDSTQVRGCGKCGGKRCRVCNFLKTGREFRSTVTNKKYVINFDLDCNSDFVVYLITCSMCSKQYVGSTINSFRKRFNNHKSRLNKHPSLPVSEKVKDDLIYQHFHCDNHLGLNNVMVQLIDKCNSEAQLREREGQWAYRLKSIYPRGLNSDDFFCSRNPHRDV